MTVQSDSMPLPPLVAGDHAKQRPQPPYADAFLRPHEDAEPSVFDESFGEENRRSSSGSSGGRLWGEFMAMHTRSASMREIDLRGRLFDEGEYAQGWARAGRDR